MTTLVLNPKASKYHLARQIRRLHFHVKANMENLEWELIDAKTSRGRYNNYESPWKIKKS